MSTFNGIIREFPDIRIDFFRRHRDVKPPSACFLSHIHSDHLQGLESPVLPFVYCSAATKRLLLRMEKYPHRINFAKGILEARKQTYRHLKKVLKALPLQTSTVIELTPKSTIRVTLFDANHCPGAVMFLIEGDGRAILYTGDIRSEVWWVNSLLRHPTMLPYTMRRRRLDCVYMDTTFAAKEDIYKDFPSKASGLAELMEKAEQYPPETIFYFRAWTLGYEDAWLALSSTLQSRIHVDTYQTRLYSGLLEDHGENISVQEAAPLVGFAAGNHRQDGCLTDDPTVLVRIHSCEPGTACHASLSKHPNMVWITPIISRTPDGTEIYEIGAGGGGGDLYQTPELDMDIADPGVLQALQALCADSLKDQAQLEKALDALEKMFSSGSRRVSLDGIGIDLDSETAVTLKDFIALISDPLAPACLERSNATSDRKLTTTIHFPYSRHSSYHELRELVSALKPKDICPCTVDLETWNEDVSMEALFGELCSERIFAYDIENRILARERRDLLAASRKRKREANDDGETQRSQEDVSDDTFKSAEDGQDHAQLQARDVQGIQDAPQQGAAQQPAEEENLDTPARRLKAIEAAFHALQDKGANTDKEESIPGTRSEQSTPDPCTTPKLVPTTERVNLTSEAQDQNGDGADAEAATDTQTSQISLSLSAFDSQPQPQPCIDPVPQVDGTSSPQPRSSRLKARIEAYHAAKASLDGDARLWEELGIRSTGYTGHVDEEVEL